MSYKTLNIEYKEFESINEVDNQTLELINEAERGLKNAYAPYSEFRVSSVCLLENGTTVHGTNQENGAYPSGLCAERVAIFSAKSSYPDQNIKKIVIVTEQGKDTPFSPCGGCRQVLVEYENTQNQPIEVVLKSGDSKIWQFKSVNDILPFAFNGSTLLKKG
jgi:cytidine deaminase